MNGHDVNLHSLGHTKTCGNCHYFESVQGPRRVGYCLAEPPHPIVVMMPNPTTVVAPGAPPMQPVTQSVERPVDPKRRACRHWQPGTEKP